MKLTDKLISLRRESGLTQLTLAEKMEVSRQTISRWESGEVLPSSDNLKRLGELYGVSVDYLISNDAERPTAAVAVMEKPESEKGWRKPALIGVVIGLAIALTIAFMAIAFFTGYDKGVQDTKPSYSILTDTLDEGNLEGGIDIKSLSTPPANTLGEEDFEGTFDLTTQ